ncbi:MAG: hypothetical protein DHS20C18_23380 [Saprospiraceae bacterium]|nr:MAG: hypothetical protein DHS20C18_23380 [Saprospiraceae bacterium]
MKKLILLSGLFLFAFSQNVLACDLCKKNQPKGLENITHGPGPSGTIDYIITWSAVIIVMVTLYLSLKFLIRPKENNPDHIKNIVLNENL